MERFGGRSAWGRRASSRNRRRLGSGRYSLILILLLSYRDKGKVKHKKPGLRHLLTGMDAGRGRHMRKAVYLNKVDSDVIKKLIPYR